MSADTETTPWSCMDCGARYAAPGDCVPCKSGPLVDTRDAQVRDGCIERDDRAVDRHNYRVWAIAFAPGVTAAIVISQVLGIVVAGIVLAIGAAVGTVLQAILRRVWPARLMFPYLR